MFTLIWGNHLFEFALICFVFKWLVQPPEPTNHHPPKQPFTAGHIHNHKAAATPEVEAAPAVAPTAEVGDGGHLGAPGPVFWGGTLTSSKMLGG